MTVQPFRTESGRFFFASRERAEASPGESIRIERVISVARLFLAVIALIALELDPVEPVSYGPIAQALFVMFAGHSVAALLVLRRRPRRARVFGFTMFTVDLLAAVMTLPIAPPNSAFFVFFLFVLASAAFRWGFVETLFTTAAALLFMLAQPLATSYFPALSGGYDDPNKFVVRTAYLAMMGLLLGYLADEGRLLRAETAAVLRLLGKVRMDVNVTRALTTVGNETVKIFRGSHLLLVVEELDTHRLFRWDTVRGWSLASKSIRGEKSATDRPAYFFGAADHSMAIVRHQWPWSSSFWYETVALDPAGQLVNSNFEVPETFLAAYPFRRVIMAPVSFGDEWSGRIFIFEPQLRAHLIELSEFLQTLIRQVSPAVFSVYLQNRLEEKAGALERARVARELHDGVIQSLIGVEMQLEVLRGQEPLRTSTAASELLRVQNVVRNEVLNLRDLMQQMRPAEFDPDELLHHFADMVQRFGRDTGISARFVTDLKRVDLERHVCFELVRIVQEALANIRKHSAATHAVVRFGAVDGAWRLEIADDGRGFPFEGRLSQVELDASSGGPAIIKERVRGIGGHLSIDSKPGRGSRLEVMVPQEGRG